MGVTDVDADWCGENLGVDRAGYRLTYYDLHGADSGFFRVRFTEFRYEDDARYMQPRATPPRLYLSRFIKNWPDIFADPTVALYITEGEKKADAMCKAGFFCIALGGVYAFKSSARGWQMLPEFDAIDFRARTVFLAYDSDVMSKHAVQGALAELATRLTERAALVKRLYLEPPPGMDRVGLDDFLLLKGTAALRELRDRSERDPNAAAFDILNERACYLEELGTFWDHKLRVMLDARHARLTLAALATVTIPASSEKRAPLVKPAFDLWVDSPARMVCRTVVYEPGNETTITRERNVNRWRAPDITPRRGTVAKWLDFLRWMFGRDEYARYFLQWLAAPLQRPGTKLNQAVFVWSEAEGVGKSFVVTPLMERLYGENYLLLSNDELASGFNGSIAHKQFALYDEAYVAGSWSRAGLMTKIKAMVTRESVLINEKYQKPYKARDCVNYYITSNHEDALTLSPEDRRFFAIHAPNRPLPRSDYDWLDQWIRHEDGPSAILYHLLNRVSLADYDIKGPAPRTEARAEIIRASDTLLEDYVQLMVASPEELLGTHGATPNALWTPTDLVNHFARSHHGHWVTTKQMGMALSRYAAELPKRVVRSPKLSRQYTLYAIHDRVLWKNRPDPEWCRYHETRLVLENPQPAANES